MLYPSSLSLIGNTPLVELSRIHIPNHNRIFAKLESYNPAGGVKDRVALHILSRLKSEGKLHKDSVIIEATAGNTGLGIAFVCLHFGVKALLVVPDKFSQEKQILMRALGADIITTPKEEGMQGAIKKAREILESHPNALSLNQFENPANPEAHYLTTAREIYEDMENLARLVRLDTNPPNSAPLAGGFSKETSFSKEALLCDDFKGYQIGGERSLLGVSERADNADSLKSAQKPLPRLDYFVAGAGSGGSFSGIARYLKEQDCRIRAVLCDPVGSIIGGGEEGCANIEGIGNHFIPKTMDTSLVDSVEKITDEQAYEGVRILAREEGLLVGISSGACLSACLKLAEKVQHSVIVTLFADDLSRYFSRELV